MTSHRVLVVEDDETIRETLIEFLEEQGYEAVGAVHGQDALDKLAGTREPPCLIVLDLMMPVMDGLAFRQQQLEDPSLQRIPVVVISAYKDLERRTSDLNVAGHLQKPLKLVDLLGLVQQHC